MYPNSILILMAEFHSKLVPSKNICIKDEFTPWVNKFFVHKIKLLDKAFVLE